MKFLGWKTVDLTRCVERMDDSAAERALRASSSASCGRRR
jgi:hypothetical protein